MKRLFYIFLFFTTFFVYWNTSHHIQNRTEAEDAYEYALMVEQGDEHSWYYHQHHLIYGPMMRGLWKSAQFIGCDVRAFDVLRLFSALCASGTLFFFFLFCYRRFSLRPVSSLLATAFYGLSYGFWRYAAESEIPLVASFFVSIALYYGTDERNQKKTFILTLLFSVLAVLIHIMNATAVFLAIPVFYVFRKRFMAMIIHVIGCAFFVLLMYYMLIGFNTDEGDFVKSQQVLSLGTVFKGLIAFIQCIISSDFVLGYRSIRAFLSELFAGRMLLEEFYYGERLSRPHVILSTLSYVGFFMSLLACIGRAILVWKTLASDRLRLPNGVTALIMPALFFFGYGAVLLVIEPGNPELWVMGLMPFCLLLCGAVFLPLTVDNRLWLPFLMILLLFCHNTMRMKMLGDEQKDFQQAKSANILRLASDKDVVVTAGNPVFERYLRYHYSGEVIYLFNSSIDKWMQGDKHKAEGCTYILGDVLNIHRSLKIRFPEKSDAINKLARRLQVSEQPIINDNFGGIYVLEVE
jgi:hypothetical protein